MIVLLILATITPCFGAKFHKHHDGLQLRENKGQVTVLEAPLFSSPDTDSFIIEHIRKGEEIYIHPAEFQIDRYRDVVDVTEEEIRQRKLLLNKMHQDPLFRDEEDTYIPEPNSRFFKTLATSGADAWILKEHVFLLYQDVRELDQTVELHDPTDYRIEEPLPEGFPLKGPKVYRSYFGLALGIPNYPAYEYPSQINDTGFDFLKEFSYAWFSSVKFDPEKRLFFGGLINVAQGQIDYQLDGRRSEETTFKISAGPLINYDLWRNDQLRVNAHTSLQFAFIDYLEIKQFSADESDTRTFQSYQFAPRAGLNIQKPKYFYSMDLVVGFNLNWDLPRTFNASSSKDRPSWWSGDSFTRDSSFQTTYFVGLQGDY
ncbi:MAG: hypothetical protein CME64_01505 [Halobacteriovoraceae bacterium]|nr:hypothetical protein [Halobacteriovoraceae bacterium]|tara:strand:+ start:18715 stop:19830 length:1116 start_codon:yes stop_codon:yes gene_type:complete